MDHGLASAEAKALRDEFDAFVHAVSHDLRAPLRALSGYAHALTEHVGEDLGTSGTLYVSRIAENASKAEKMLDALLHLSRIGRAPLRRTAVDLTALCRRIAGDLSLPDAQLQLASEMRVDADPSLARVVLSHLLENAFKFTRGAELPSIEVGQDGELIFVRDNGVGFDTRLEGRLFGLFQSLHGPEQPCGMGTGLATVRRIVTRHGGRCWAEGSPGAGATFFVSFEPGKSGRQA